MGRIIYTLSGMFTKQKLNHIFLQFVNMNPQALKRQTHFFVYGAPGGCFWKGGHVDHQCDILTWNDIDNVAAEYTRQGCAMRLDFSGLNLDKEIPFDTFGKVSAELLDNGVNQICVSNNEAYDAFKAKFPNFPMAASEFNLQERDRDYLTITRNAHNFDPKLPRVKAEILLHAPCDNCPIEKWGECVMASQIAILTSSFESPILSCAKLHTDIHAVDDDRQIEECIKQGFYKFQAFDWPHITKQLEVYLYDLIKPEFREEGRNWIMLHYMED